MLSPTSMGKGRDLRAAREIGWGSGEGLMFGGSNKLDVRGI